MLLNQLRPLVPDGITLTQFALKWILMNPAVTCAIPGAKNPTQTEENIQLRRYACSSGFCYGKD